jgi:hypothetical protein
VLSSQRVDLNNALYDAMKGKDQVKNAAVNPLVQSGKKLIPSVTRVFSTSRDMYVYLQAYKPDAAPVQPLIAFVTLYRAQAKVFETQPAAVQAGPVSRLGMVPLSFSIALNQLPPGEYDCQVTVLNPTVQKATFWQTPIMLVP